MDDEYDLADESAAFFDAYDVDAVIAEYAMRGEDE